MNKLIVLDGDFEAQLHRYLNSADKLDKYITLKALRSNKVAVYETHLDYLRAGAQIIRSNTSRISISSLRNHLQLSGYDCQSMIITAIKLAKKALHTYYFESVRDISNGWFKQNRFCLNQPSLAGCCGSYGATNFLDAADTLNEIEILSENYLTWFYKHRINMLLENNVDLLAFDSISTLKETEAIIRTLRSYPHARAWITFSCSQNAKLLDGTSFEEAATFCSTSLPEQFIAIGPECDVPDLMMPTIQKMKSEKILSEIPYMIYANKSLFSTTEDIYTPSTSLQRSFVNEWVDNGIQYIGGGAGTVMEDVMEICRQMDDYIKGRQTVTAVNPCFQNNKNQSKL